MNGLTVFWLAICAGFGWHFGQSLWATFNFHLNTRIGIWAAKRAIRKSVASRTPGPAKPVTNAGHSSDRRDWKVN